MVSVLLVDANRNIREFCKRELERNDYHVTTVRGAAEASAVAAETLPDVVVADADLPTRGLITFLRELWSRSVPVVLHVSACPPASDISLSLADGCIQKSGDMRELRQAIVRALGRRRAPPPTTAGAPTQEAPARTERSWDEDGPD